jgi:hypothetical protein
MNIKVKMKVKMKIKQKKQKRAEIFFVFLENFETLKIVIRHIISYRTKIRKSYKIPKVT